jgi:hypothetical protein
MEISTTSLLLLGLLVGCATTGSLGTAANRLDDSSQRFYEQLQAERAAGHTDTDAALLADAARDFNRAVSQSGSREKLRAGFDRVTQAYLDVDRAMNHPDSGYHN